jgi:hypothetical protein
LARLGLKQEAKQELEAREWAATSLLLYDFLADLDDPIGRAAVELSSMTFRAWLVLHLGADGLAASDPGILERWFFDRLEMSLPEAREKSLNWIQLPTNEIARLRAIKTRINVIKILPDLSVFRREAELSDWVALRERLP